MDFKKAWNGEISLAKVYWIYGVLVGVFLQIIFKIIESSLVLCLLFLALSLVYQIFLNVAVWRSARKYEGPKIWAFLARTLVTFNTIVTIIILLGLLKS